MHKMSSKITRVDRKLKKLLIKHSALVVAGFVAPLFLTALLLVAVVENNMHQSAGRITSRLEVGVADLSPRGDEGGAYIPASCVLGPGVPGGHEACAPTVTWTPASVTIPYGGTANFSWSSTQAYYCNQVVTGLAAGVGNFVGGGTSGSYVGVVFNTSGVQTRTMTCWDSDNLNSFTAVLNITVLPEVRLQTAAAGVGYPWAKISSFGAPTNYVGLYDGTTLTWASTGDCTATGAYPGWAGAKPASGSFPAPNRDIVSTTRAYTYYLFTLSCTKNATTDSKNFQITYENDWYPSASCFTSGTAVSLADGSTKNIADIVVGDKVRGMGGVANTVIGVEAPPLGARLLYSINGGTAFVTAEHPFMTTEGWKSIDPEMTKKENAKLDVGVLSVGDTLVTAHGNVSIESITPKSGNPVETLYNLLLNGDHTYYADGYLVHNKILQ